MRNALLVAASWLIAVASMAAQFDESSLKPIRPDQWDRAAAEHLLRRAGFGGTPEQVEALAAMTPEQAVASLVDYQNIPYDPPPPLIDDILREPPDRRRLRDLPPEQRRKLFQQRQAAERRSFAEIRLWWIERMVESPRPLEEKMTLFWHGHFTSGFREVRRAVFMYEQNQFLRRRALDNFRELLVGISRDRAMLVYLDGFRNRKKHPNENYARELMELFTLGVGHYTEQDVIQAARAFTGFGFDDHGFVFRPREHDDGVKRFLGHTGRFDGDDIIDIILKQPACSRFLARKLLTFFVRPDPPKRLVENLAKEIRRQKYELKPVMRTLFLSQAFYAPAARGSLIKSPVELVVGTARQLGVKISNLPEANRAMIAMGQELLQPPNVKGWDGGTKWINTATLFTRYNTIAGLVYGTPGAQRRNERRLRQAAAKAGVDFQQMMASSNGATRMLGADQPPYDPRPVLERYELRTAGQIVDFYAEHLLAVPLPEDKRAELVTYLQGDAKRFDPTARATLDRVRTTIHLLCSTPEFQLN